MRRNLFGLQGYSSYFQQRTDTTDRLGLSTYQKCNEAIWMLAYGVADDAMDDYIWIGETIEFNVRKKSDRVIKEFGKELEKPSANDPDDYCNWRHMGFLVC